MRRKYFKPLGMLSFLWRLVSSSLALRRLIRRESVSLVHSNTVSVFSGAFAARLAGCRHVWHVHEIVTRPRALNRLISWLVPRLSDVVVAVSAATRDNLCRADARNVAKCIVLHNGIDPNPFIAAKGQGGTVRLGWGIQAQELVIGMVGRISFWKGQDYLLDVANLVSQRYKMVRFVMVGGTVPGNEGLLEKLQRKASELHLSSSVTFSSFRRDIPAVLDAFDIFVLPSTLPDPLPTVVLEAMAAGKPVVANAHGGSLEMVEEGVTGFLVNPHQPAEMAAAICRLVNEPDLRLRMGQKGRERVIQRFSMNAFAQNWLQLYDKMLEQSH